MMKNTTAKSPFSKLVHVAVLVRDLDKAAKRFESLGIGPFAVTHPPPGADGLYIGDKLWDGVESKKYKCARGKWGQVQLELIQPTEVESLYTEILNSKGEVIVDIGFEVDNIDETVAKLAEQGASILYTANLRGRMAAAYVDLGVGGVITEVMCKELSQYFSDNY